MGRTGVTICVDTNVLVRAAVRDDKALANKAAKILEEAERVAVPLSCLCEFVWVLRSTYKFTRTEIAASLTSLVNASNVVCNRQAVETGLAAMRQGCDFADGVILHEGSWLGGETYVSSDEPAVRFAAKLGKKTLLL